MKTTNVLSGIVAVMITATACSSNKEGRFLNLTSGEEVSIVENDNGQMVDEATGKPVSLYVNTRTNDTIYGPTGDVVNGHLSYDDDANLFLYEDGDKEVKIDGGEYKMKSRNAKVKADMDGSEYKYKDDNVTIKKDGDDYKEERKGYTKKVDEDGDVKIETKDKKYKIDGETGERKVKDKSVFSKVKDKVTGQ